MIEFEYLVLKAIKMLKIIVAIVFVWSLSIQTAIATVTVKDTPAISSPCVACHGVDGNSVATLYPTLAAQHQDYLFLQMQGIRDGTRAIPLMTGQLDGMTDANLRDLALYYSGQKLLMKGSPDTDISLGQRIFRGGIVDKKVAACSACHSPRGLGNSPANFPRLSGQVSEYVITALKAYRAGNRKGVITADLMPQIAANLSDNEIEALAIYIQGLY